MSLNDNILMSTGSICRFPEFFDINKIAEAIKNVEWNNFEFLICSWDSLDNVADTILKTGKNFKTVHSQKHIGSGFGSSDKDEILKAKKKFRDNVDFTKYIGAKIMTLHLWDLPDSDRHLDTNIKHLEESIGYAESCGICVSVETILGCVNDPIKNVKHVLKEINNKNLGVTYDMEFLYRHNCLETSKEDSELIKSVKNVHIRGCDDKPFKENGKRRYLKVAQGTVDVKSYLRKLKSNKYNGFYTIESSYIGESGKINYDDLNRDLNYLKNILNYKASND